MSDRIDAWDNLNPVQWGPLVLPVVSISAAVQPRIEQYKYLNATAAELRSLGFESRTFNVSLAYFESNGFFPDAYKRFLKLYMMGEPKPFKHPVHGDMLCFCSNWNETIESTIRNGLLVSCTFTETLSDQPTNLIELKPSKATSFSSAVFQEAAIQELEEEEPDLFDTLNSINTLGDQLNGMRDQVNRTTSQVQNRLKTTVNKAIDTLKTSSDPDAFIAVAALREQLEVWLAASSESESNVNYQSLILDESASIDDISARTGNSTATLEKLNPNIVGVFVVPSSTAILYEAE